MKKQILYTAIAICAILLSQALSVLYCDDGKTAAFRYNAAGKRDPFIPLVTREGKITLGYGTINSVEDIKLEGIVYDPRGGSIAIINGMVLKENDMFGDIKLTKIESNKVHLVFNQSEYIIELEKEK